MTTPQPLNLAQKKASAYTALHYLEPYLPPHQAKIVRSNIRSSEEAEYFMELVCDLAEQFMFAPRTYGQGELGNDAIAYFHYFKGGYDCYVTELDMGDPADPEDRGQHQVRALCRFAHMPECAELGYVSFPELFESQVELDFHWEPKTLREIKNSFRDRQTA